MVRPFRSVLGVDLGIADRNASDEAHDAQINGAWHAAIIGFGIQIVAYYRHCR